MGSRDNEVPEHDDELDDDELLDEDGDATEEEAPAADEAPVSAPKSTADNRFMTPAEKKARTLAAMEAIRTGEGAEKDGALGARVKIRSPKEDARRERLARTLAALEQIREEEKVRKTSLASQVLEKLKSQADGGSRKLEPKYPGSSVYATKKEEGGRPSVDRNGNERRPNKKKGVKTGKKKHRQEQPES